MKKLIIVSFLLIFISFFAFGQSENQAEIDYLLFLPNSSNEFIDEARATVQLDILAKYLSGRSLIPGQIFVYGYAAHALNDIDPIILSKDRALFVINELQKRGISRDLFSEPVGYGSVDLWGSNINEEDKGPNRRVRVILDGNIITPEIIKAEEPQPIPEPIKIEPAPAPAPVAAKTTDTTAKKFPWWILLLLLLIPLFLLLFKRKKSSAEKPVKPEPQKVVPVKAEPVKVESVKAAPPPPAPSPAPAIVAAPVAAKMEETKKTINLDEEIRRRAYELHAERGYQHGNADGDWYEALVDVCSKYESAEYKTYFEDDYWWALYHKKFKL